MNWKTQEEWENLGVYYRVVARGRTPRQDPGGTKDFQINIPSELKRKVKRKHEEPAVEVGNDSIVRDNAEESEQTSIDQVFSSTKLGISKDSDEMLDSVKRPRLSPILVKSRTEKNDSVHKIVSLENDSVFLPHTDISAPDIPEPDSSRGQINIIEELAEPVVDISAHIEQTSHHEFVTKETTVYEDIAKDNVDTELNISPHIEQPDHQEHSTKETTFYSVNKSKSLTEVESAEESKKSENCNRIVLQARKFLETFKTKKSVKTNNNPPKVVQNDQVTKPPEGFKGYKLEPHFPPQSAGGRKYRTMMGETNRIASNLAQWRFNLENRLQLYSSH